MRFAAMSPVHMRIRARCRGCGFRKSCDQKPGLTAFNLQLSTPHFPRIIFQYAKCLRGSTSRGCRLSEDARSVRRSGPDRQVPKREGYDAPQGSINDEGLRRRIKNGDFDMLIAVGGDGTMLRAGQLCAPVGVPIFGIKIGTPGFLMQVESNEWREMLARLFKGEAWNRKTYHVICKARPCRKRRWLAGTH